MALLAATGCSACSRGVQVSIPVRASDTACTTAAAAWPGSVSGRSVVTTDPVSSAVRAWGDPAIVARCGVDPPGPTTDDCLTVNGVDWVATPLSDGTRFVTYGRDPAIEVLIPRGDQPEGSLLPVFTASADALPTTGRHCS
ncbi:MAG: DUF3515 domain-containing protein [Actinomycetota bacterium]|nr:DUF3515 domain-containing protein [Actinomycetota bacterium]